MYCVCLCVGGGGVGWGGHVCLGTSTIWWLWLMLHVSKPMWFAQVFSLFLHLLSLFNQGFFCFVFFKHSVFSEHFFLRFITEEAGRGKKNTFACSVFHEMYSSSLMFL